MNAAATAAAAQPIPRLPVPLPPARRPFLRLVPVARRKAPRAPFIAMVIAVLGAGLVGLLILNTQQVQNSIKLAGLRAADATLNDQLQTLQRQSENDQDPATLAARATALGMVPGGTPGFVDAHGHVIGPIPAGAPVPTAKSPIQGGVVVAGSIQLPTVAPPPVAPKVLATPTVRATGKAKVTATKAKSAPKATPSAKPATTAKATPSAKPATTVKATPTSGAGR